MATINVSELVEIYIRIRTARNELKNHYEAEDGVLKEDLGHIEAELLSACNKAGADSIKTEYGTVMKKLTERFYGVDWELFKNFVKENDALDLFEKRISQSNIKDLIAARPGEGIPPGVNVFREYGVTVRKSNQVKDDTNGERSDSPD
jgi:hypothetical protein